MQPRPSRHDQGFTLIELLVVILIIGILIAVSAPSFLGQTQKAQDSASKQYLAIAYRAAKADSVDREGSFGTAAQVAQAINDSEPELNAVSGTCPASTTTDPKDIVVDHTFTGGQDLKLCNDPNHTVWTLTVTGLGSPVFSSDDVPLGAHYAGSFASQLDQNGYLYWRGTQAGEAAWSNPTTQGVTISLSGAGFWAGGTDSTVDRVADSSHELYTNTGDSVQRLTFDLGAGHSLQISGFDYVGNPSNDGRLLAGSSLEGSDDGSSWTTLWTASATVAGGGTFVTVAAPTAYRYLRVVRASDPAWWQLEEIELYGAGQ